MTDSLYILGGRQRKRLLKEEEEWTLYDKAVVLEVNPKEQTVLTCLEYETPAEARFRDESSVLFKAGTLRGNQLYACTSTEVLIYEVPSFNLRGYISLPCFNDLHHVTITPHGRILIANTGLDMVLEVNLNGEILREWDVLGEHSWSRFSRTVDYRKVETTKPHRSHPNFVFTLGDEVWVTRAQQKDAICLTDSERRIPIGNEYVHDGHLHNGMIYFTSVDSCVIIVDQKRLGVVDVIDLKTIDNSAGALLGWCRGLRVVDERHVWVGFTRVRKTRFKENINWVKHVGRDLSKPARIALYDIVARKCLMEVDVEQYGMNVVFSILPTVPSRSELRSDDFEAVRVPA